MASTVRPNPFQNQACAAAWSCASSVTAWIWQAARSQCSPAAYPRLVTQGMLTQQADGYRLTPCGAHTAALLRRARPPICYWYVDFYQAIQSRRAHGSLCERLFGKNLGQDGLAEIGHLATMLEALKVCAADRVLDLGCGNGGITAYLAAASGAHVF